MATNREMVSLTRGKHKLLGDAQITDRSILRDLKNCARVFIKQRMDRRQLFNTPSIYSTIPCVELIPVPLSDCCDFMSDRMITRSKHKLPKIGEHLYGLAVQGVFSIEGNLKLSQTNPGRYANSLKLGLKNRDESFWILDGYLYTTLEYAKLVKIVAFFEEDIPNSLLYPPCDCKYPSKLDPCTNPLDGEFKCPGFLEGPVIDKVSNDLLRSYFAVKDDHTSDSKNDQTNKE